MVLKALLMISWNGLHVLYDRNTKKKQEEEKKERKDINTHQVNNSNDALGSLPINQSTQPTEGASASMGELDSNNPIFIVVIVFITSHWLLTAILEWLNSRATQEIVPLEVGDVYEPNGKAGLSCMSSLPSLSCIIFLVSSHPPPPPPYPFLLPIKEYARSQQYLSERARFSLLVNTVSTASFVALWLSGFFNAFDNTLRKTIHDSHQIVLGLLFFGVLGLVHYLLLQLPAALYSTFSIEARYGFNRTSMHTFIMDQLKMIAINLFAILPLLAAAMAFLEHASSKSILDFSLLFLGAVALLLLTTFLAPVVLLPMFVKLSPLPNGPLRVCAKNKNALLLFVLC
jgi:CAAX prenyl protease N-terminal, five membrane helices